MHKLIVIILATVFLACGSGSSNPLAPGGDNSDNQTPDTPADNPLVGTWTVTELAIIGAEGDTMSQGSPNASGSAVFDSSTASITVNLFGLPTVRESGDYTFDSATITVILESTGETKNWDYSVDGNTLTLSGVRNSGGEDLGLRITASK